MFAVEFLHLNLVEYLLTKAPLLHLNAADADGNTAVILAVLAGVKGIPILRRLLEAKADAEMADRRKRTALYIACEQQNVEVVNALFDYEVVRNASCLALLQSANYALVQERIIEEERLKERELMRLQREREVRARDGIVDLRNEDPRGKWVLLNDKRKTGLFYYNTVSRVSQRKEPVDYIADPTKPIRDVTFGMHFYKDV